MNYTFYTLPFFTVTVFLFRPPPFPPPPPPPPLRHVQISGHRRSTLPICTARAGARVKYQTHTTTESAVVFEKKKKQNTRRYLEPAIKDTG
ncbi:hypothetical protein EYF80_025833 [Liparis tanakae]|uniref:Uncharacterized protein n=1 Tax=Liparis tanakae TaxID=230148 RepID=A0A4Z2HEF2_9TELE|nr:hypothetical protein EYF80_025833 [Liparis tanakae]